MGKCPDRDILCFLQNGVVSLYNLLVREKRDTRDSKGMYIISQSKVNPEMYEVIFSTTLEMQRWAQVMRAAANRCPAEGKPIRNHGL